MGRYGRLLGAGVAAIKSGGHYLTRKWQNKGLARSAGAFVLASQLAAERAQIHTKKYARVHLLVD